MSEQNDPLLLEHEADGIRELDNFLPKWWVWLFYLTIIFSVFYVGYYHVLGKGDLQAAAYEKEYAAGEALKQAAIQKFEASLGSLEPSEDAAVLEDGKRVYSTMCQPCHRPDGGGLVGPNLCDDFWIHGSNYVDSLKIIINGNPEKGMLSWKSMFKPGEIQAVASYIYKFRGTDPPNPKPREDQAAAADTGPSEFE